MFYKVTAYRKGYRPTREELKQWGFGESICDAILSAENQEKAKTIETMPTDAVGNGETKLVPEDFATLKWEMNVTADNVEDARKQGLKALREDHEDPAEYKIFIEEMTVEDLIQEEERQVRHVEENVFFDSFDTKNWSIREYSDYRRRFDPESNPEQRYEVLKAFNRYVRTLKMLTKKCDKDKCTVGEFLNVADQLFHCDDEDEFQKIWDSFGS